MLTLEQVYSLLYADLAANPPSLPMFPWGTTGNLPERRIHTTIIGSQAQRLSTDNRNTISGMLVLSIVTPDEPQLISVGSALLTRYLRKKIGGIRCGYPAFRNLGASDGLLLRGDVRVTFEEEG